MKLVKLEHSGVAIEKDGQWLLIDPVEFTVKLPDFRNVVAIVVTHQHNDHFQPPVLQRILATNPEAKIFAPADTANKINGAEAVNSGAERDFGSFHLEFFGQDHAEIIPGETPCQNIGVVVDDTVAHPGDSFSIPPVKPRVLLAPISAPWCKIFETLDYIKPLRPEIVVPCHDAVLSELGKTYNNNWLKSACDLLEIKDQVMQPNTVIEIN